MQAEVYTEFVPDRHDANMRLLALLNMPLFGYLAWARTSVWFRGVVLPVGSSVRYETEKGVTNVFRRGTMVVLATLGLLTRLRPFLAYLGQNLHHQDERRKALCLPVFPVYRNASEARLSESGFGLKKFGS